MSYDAAENGAFDAGFVASRAERSPGEQADLLDLVEVLLAHPAGLRRWSVMRAIRKARQLAGRDISMKLEDEIERAFRKSCVGDVSSHGSDAGAPKGPALFYRPKEKAGEVWAADAERARAWLRMESAGGLPNAIAN